MCNTSETTSINYYSHLLLTFFVGYIQQLLDGAQYDLKYYGD